jgi:hypothetical protein
MAQPPITLEEARSVVRRGFVSGLARACEFDWQSRSYLPMMAYWRRSQGKDERQMALIGTLHGIAQGQAYRALSQQPCSAETRRLLEAQLQKRP